MKRVKENFKYQFRLDTKGTGKHFSKGWNKALQKECEMYWTTFSNNYLVNSVRVHYYTLGSWL